MDDTEELINTTHRYNVYCKAHRKSDGLACHLYSPHNGVRHTNKDLNIRFTDEEAE